MKTTKILDLFAGTQSVRKALTEMYGVHWNESEEEYGVWLGCHCPGSNGWCDGDEIIEYIGIDIYSPEEENIILDLTQDDIVNKLKEKLGDWKPDFIWASPVCNKLSLTTALIGGHNPYFKVDKENGTITPWPIGAEFPGGRKTFVNVVGSEKANAEALWTLKMFENTKKIVNHFNVAFAIENPTHSLTKYLMKEYVGNKCSYCMYGFKVRKNTTIYTNKEINLDKCKGHVKGDHEYIHRNEINQALNLPNVKSYDQRAAVPPKLIQQIIKEVLND